MKHRFRAFEFTISYRGGLKKQIISASTLAEATDLVCQLEGCRAWQIERYREVPYQHTAPARQKDYTAILLIGLFVFAAIASGALPAILLFLTSPF